MTIVCGDSHTSTHGAFGALAFGIGTSEVEHVLATQTLLAGAAEDDARALRRASLPFGVTAKDLVLGAIGRIGVAGGVGHAIEYAGPAIEALSMEGRMTVCNMSIEAGARSGMVAPDDTTFAYLEGRPAAPRGAAWERRARRVARPAVRRGRVLRRDRSRSTCRRSRRRSPGARTRAWSRRSTASSPTRPRYDDPVEREVVERALRYMALEPGTPIREIRIDRVFIGSCTNARIEDLRAAAAVVDGRRVAPTASARWSCRARRR